MNLKEIRELIDLAKDAGINELEVAEGTGDARKQIRIVVASAATPSAPVGVQPRNKSRLLDRRAEKPATWWPRRFPAPSTKPRRRANSHS